MSVSTLAAIDPGPGCFQGFQLDGVNSIVSAQNANNTSLLASIAALAAGVLTSGASGLTAHAGGTQAAALALTAAINSVGTVGTIGDSVRLPTSVAGGICVVINDAAKALQAFGASTDTIDDVATATGVQVPGKSTAVFWCPVAGKWYQLSRSFLGGQVLSADGAVSPNIAATYAVTKAGVALLTLAAPTATVDDYKVIVITSNTANAHTLTATGLLQTGTATVNLATFAAFAGASITLMAYQAKWNVISLNAVVLT